MGDQRTRATILLVDDDPDFCLLVRKATERAAIDATLDIVGDGEEMMDYLHRKGAFAKAPIPHLVLLDLNMPGIDGREALRRAKSEPQLLSIPIVVLSASRSQRDIEDSYRAGANSFISKPESFDGLVFTMRALARYWLHTVTALPDSGRV